MRTFAQQLSAVFSPISSRNAEYQDSAMRIRLLTLQARLTYLQTKAVSHNTADAIKASYKSLDTGLTELNSGLNTALKKQCADTLLALCIDCRDVRGEIRILNGQITRLSITLLSAHAQRHRAQIDAPQTQATDTDTDTEEDTLNRLEQHARAVSPVSQPDLPSDSTEIFTDSDSDNETVTLTTDNYVPILGDRASRAARPFDEAGNRNRYFSASLITDRNDESEDLLASSDSDSDMDMAPTAPR